MPSITIRDVPEHTRNELASRAAKRGQSLQEYLRTELEELADEPDPQEWMERVRTRVRGSGVHVSAEQIRTDLEADRR